MSSKSSRLCAKAATSPLSGSSMAAATILENESTPRQRKSPRSRLEATKAKLAQMEAKNLNSNHETTHSEKLKANTSKETSPKPLQQPARRGYFSTPARKLHSSSPQYKYLITQKAMRWCCGGVSNNEVAGITTVNGGSNGRRQQLTIQGDQVVLDATTAAALNNLHQGNEPRPSTSSSEAYQFASTSQHAHFKTSHPVVLSGGGAARNSAASSCGGMGASGGRVGDSNHESILSPRNAALIMDKYGPMLLRPCKSALFITSTSPSSTSTSATAILECAFLEKLRQSDWQLNVCNSISANSEVQKHRPVIVIFDNKLSDLTSISRSLHALPESEDVLFGVLSDRVLSDKRKKALLKCELHEYFLISSKDTSICELFAKLAARLRAIPALFAVVEEAEQPIKICDERNIVQYVNRAYEIQTGCSRAEVLGSDAGELHSKAIHTSATLPPHPPPPLHVIGSTPNEAMEVTPEGGDSSTGNVNIPHNYNPNRRRSSEWHCITVPGSSNPQFVYVKRGSADATICRDLSLKSLRSQGALVDAPITEALTVLANVLHKCDEETQPMVRDAIKLLSSNELYAPTITRFQHGDRIASGYYDGLIRLHHPSRQRKRSVVDAFREQRRSSATDSRRRISSDVVNILENEDSWNFDVIELERVTEHHPLSHLGAKVFERWNCIDVLRCSADTIARWLTVIEANYQNCNTYHNATHAADVLQATSFFLTSDVVGQNVQDNHATAALIAATVHDLDHPGRGNAFLINTRQRLALLYNDQSVLENHHVALAFTLTLAQSGINIFARMPREEFIQMRQSIIDMVLATDMSRHFEYLTKFQQILPNLPDLDENREANSMTVCRMMIKCADIANPTREWKLCHQWAMRIVEEYFFQTAEEREKGLPLTMKGFERDTCNVPMTQCTFVDMFAREAFTLWCDFAEIPNLLQQLENNYDKWKQMSNSWDPTQNVDLISKAA